MKIKCLIIFFLFIVPVVFLSAQETDANLILKKAQEKVEGIHDYQADVEIKVDVDFIKMPDKHAVVYYKQPDKLRFKSDEFIMLPGQGMDFNINKLLKDPYTAVLTGLDTLGHLRNYIIRIIPLQQGSDIVLSTLWIDVDSYRLRKSETTTRSGGTYSVEFSYDHPDMALPSEMKINFDIQGMEMPSKFIGNLGDTANSKSNPMAKKTGSVYLFFLNYKINKGIDDKIFTDQK